MPFLKIPYRPRSITVFDLGRFHFNIGLGELCVFEIHASIPLGMGVLQQQAIVAMRKCYVGQNSELSVSLFENTLGVYHRAFVSGRVARPRPQSPPNVERIGMDPQFPADTRI